jgi:hypothetical protein
MPLLAGTCLSVAAFPGDKWQNVSTILIATRILPPLLVADDGFTKHRMVPTKQGANEGG